ncbi:MAG: BatD family protein [Methylococcaceae bacterium]
MPKILFTLFFLLTPCWLSAAEISASVDRPSINLDDSFRLTFTATESPDGEPDFSALEEDFEVINQSKSSQSSLINGTFSKTIQWSLNVMAKHSGDLTIPAIPFGSDTSQTSHIIVADNTAKNDTASISGDLFLEVEASPKTPYVQSQVLYTMRLYGRVDMSQASLNEPALNDAVVEKLGDEDIKYNTQINGVDYWVIERKYAIFPQKSGQLTIKPLTLNAQVITNNRPLFNGFFNPQQTQTKRLSSQPITLDVKPVPTAFTGSHWLSADELYLKQEWSSADVQIKVGEPLTRTLSLLAKNTAVSQLPQLNNEKATEQLKTYPDQPVLQEQKKADGIIAFREEKIAIIASKAGEYTLPAIEIPWFNTKTQTMEIARLPAVKLTAIATEVQSSNPNKLSATAEAMQPAPPAPISLNNDLKFSNNKFWLWVSIALACGWFLTTLYFLRNKKPVKVPEDQAKLVKIDAQESIKQLKQACLNNDATAAKNALLYWGGLTLNAHSLGAIGEQTNALLRDEINLLNRVLYANSAEPWQGKKLFQAFTENAARTRMDKNVGSSLLAPLHRL